MKSKMLIKMRIDKHKAEANRIMKEAQQTSQDGKYRLALIRRNRAERSEALAKELEWVLKNIPSVKQSLKMLEAKGRVGGGWKSEA